MSQNVSAAAKIVIKTDPESLSPSDCARVLYSIVTQLRESSFYSKNQQPLSGLRLNRFFKDLESHPLAKKNLQKILYRILDTFNFSSLLTQTGLSKPHGFVQELIGRLFDKILPRHSRQPNFRQLVYFLFPSHTDAEFFARVSPDSLNALLSLFDPEMKDADAGREYLSKIFYDQIIDSLIILGAETLVLAESNLLDDIRYGISQSAPTLHPFLELNNFLHQTIRNLKAKTGKYSVQELDRDFNSLLGQCRADLILILNHLEGNSLSVDLVYQIEILHLLVDRIQALMNLTVLAKRSDNSTRATDFLAHLIVQEQRRRSVRVLVNQNLHFLARKIVDHAGETGDHYIARNPKESQELFKAALGGGFITGFTTLIKVLLHGLHAALFFEGFFAGANYASSFVFMQFTHLTLATKQPSMTAAALARRMTEIGADLSGLRDEMLNLLRSQALAAAGNVCAVIPTSYCLYLAWQLFFNHNYMTVEEAHATIQAHNPVQSLTILYALFTGVILTSTGIVHGWVANWMAFRGIPELLAESFLVENFLSREKRIRLGAWLHRNLAGIVANTALGLLLAFTPIIGKFFALPLDVRHVTLSTGTLTLAYASLPPAEITASMLAVSVAGIAIILLGNILTSFIISMWLALRARGWRWRDVREVIRSLPRS